MAENKSVFGIFTESIGLYFSNIKEFVKYMTFPVLGQIAGLLLVFIFTYFYTQNLPGLLEKYPNLNNFESMFILTTLITLPGLAIFVKAFWEYLVAYGSINSMYENMKKSGKVYDFSAHTELIKRRTFSFISLWLLFGIFQFFAICPLFWIICGIFTIYFVLIFQAFTFEPELTPIGCAKRSLTLIKGNFIKTFILFALAALLTYFLIPQLCSYILDFTGINNFLAKLVLPMTSMFPIPDLTTFGINQISQESIANLTITVFVSQILIQYTLPLRSIMWSIWYKELSKTSSFSNSNSKSKKRPSEVLMEETHKKYGKKQLDRNIIKRATKKDKKD